MEMESKMNEVEKSLNAYVQMYISPELSQCEITWNSVKNFIHFYYCYFVN